MPVRWFLLFLALAWGAPGQALQKQIIECGFNSVGVQKPPSWTGNYRIEREWVRKEPAVVYDQEAWDAAEFEDIGVSSVTLYLVDQTTVTEQGAEPWLRITDRHDGDKDRISDLSLGSGELELEGWVVDDFGFTIFEDDGTLINDHLTVPDLDPAAVTTEYDDFEFARNGCQLHISRLDLSNTESILGTLLSYEVAPGELDDDDPGFAINAGLNDAWFNPATAGQGFFIIVFPDIPLIFMAWFTYDTERPDDGVMANLGETGHRWLTAQGGFAGDTATLEAFVTAGGVFDAIEPAPGPAGKIGTITIVWADCETALLSYDFPDLGLMGEVPIQRIALDNVALCEALAAES